MPDQESNKNFSLTLLLLIVLILGGIYYLYTHGSLLPNNKFSSENVKLSKVDISKPLDAFPADLPIDKSNIVQANALDYPDRRVTLYSISYRSGNQLEGLYNIYKNYLSSHSYTIVSSSKSPSLIFFQATMGRDDISINITPDASGSNLVNVAITHRK